MKCYDINVANIIARGICDREVSTDTTLSFPCLLTQICLEKGTLEILVVDKIMMVQRTTDLGLIRDYANPILKAMVGATLL